MSAIETFRYDNRVVRAFAWATVFWGFVGMSVGLLAACQLFWPGLNLDLPFTTFGRIRPLHTNAVIFAFVGNGMFTGIYYSVQRLLKTRMYSDTLSWFNLWGWNLIIVAAAITLPLGLTTSKEYAELEWPIDIAIAVVWIAFTVNLPGTILRRRERHMYGWLEGVPVTFTVVATVAVLVGGLVEIVPMLLISSNVPRLASVQPYTPLELLGRDIYIREGCVGCHAQMVRPFRSETERCGEYSKSGEFVFDHPFLWGSKRTGPDLHRVGGKYPDAWHYNHMNDPRSTSPGSIMPRYPWLLTQKLDMSSLPARIRTLRRLGVPYPPEAEDTAIEEARTQAQQVVANLKAGMVETEPDREIIALIAYLQRLGRDIRQPSSGPVTAAHGAGPAHATP
jgi:cbb3-type cytochrome c oxidase subunit II